MAREQPVVLVVDRDSEDTRGLIAFLRVHGFEAVWSKDGESALNALDATRADGLVTEVRAPRIDGMAVLRRARERYPEVCAVLITDAPGVETAVEAMRLGAYDFQVKPLHLDKLLEVLRRGLSHAALAARVDEMEDRLDRRFGLAGLVGRSRAMERVAEQVRHAAAMRAPVLVEGEAGTGKARVAQAIHQLGPRKGERFVTVDCEALGAAGVEVELFGHERAAGRGAPAARRGRLELADGGTLFLDEIAALAPAAQVRLLRVLQDRAFERVGGERTLRADVRLIAATRRDLAAEVRAGSFRDDLHLRLAAVRVAMPALRERREDIPLLVEHAIREADRAHGRRVTGITRGALDRLVRAEWPGNVRELVATVEGMVVTAHGRRALGLSDLPEPLRAAGGSLEIAVGLTLEEAERHLLVATYEHTGRDKARTAEMLGIGLRTLYRRLRRFGLR
jgi:two-component system NtrC family response regulator/two-component system response regulator HydG